MSQTESPDVGVDVVNTDVESETDVTAAEDASAPVESEAEAEPADESLDAAEAVATESVEPLESEVLNEDDFLEEEAAPRAISPYWCSTRDGTGSLSPRGRQRRRLACRPERLASGIVCTECLGDHRTPVGGPMLRSHKRPSRLGRFRMPRGRWFAFFAWNLARQPLLVRNEPQLPRLWESSHAH